MVVPVRRSITTIRSRISSRLIDRRRAHGSSEANGHIAALMPDDGVCEPALVDHCAHDGQVAHCFGESGGRGVVPDQLQFDARRSHAASVRFWPHASTVDAARNTSVSGTSAAAPTACPSAACRMSGAATGLRWTRLRLERDRTPPR